MGNRVVPGSSSFTRVVWFVLTLFIFSPGALAQTQILGSSQVQSSIDTNSTGMAEAFPVIASSSGQVNYLSLFLDASNTARSISVGLYTSEHGHPRELLSQALIPQPVSGRWNSVQIPAVKVFAGRRYWVAVLGLSGQLQFRDANSRWCYSETSEQTTLTSLPTSWWPGSRYSTCIVSMFGSGGPATTVSVTVSPTAASLQPTQQKQFAASVSGTTNTAVTWKTSGGIVTSGGLYTAPSTAGTYTVTAISSADSTKSASANVTVSQPTQVSISVSPGAASIQTGAQQQFVASVSGTSNTAVLWKATGGTITTTGLYTAPSTAGAYTVSATSSADPTKSASAGVTVSQPTQVAVSISPGTASIQTGAQQQFSASVSGTTNTGVTWKTSGGTVTTAGMYTAPSTAGTYIVTATSSADSTKSASASVAVTQPTQISVSVSPTNASLQSGAQQQFAAYVSGTSNTAVTWKASAGTITTTGLYTAPATAGTYLVTAVSAADGTTSASATVGVTAPQNVAIAISPTTVSMPAKWQQQFAATVSGSTNTGVTWAVTKGTGTITQSGMYTAPQLAENDVVTATSQADTTKLATASVTVAAPHSVTLNWSPSTTTGVTYNVYRGTVSGGPYSLLSTGLTSTTYVDTKVQSGATYYYVTTAADSAGESGYSNMVQAVIPMP